MSTESVFCRAVVKCGYLTEEQMLRAAERYRLGRSRDGGVIFWQIDEEGRTRDLRIYDTTDSTSFSYVNYICVEGKWVKRSSLYSNCDNDKDCLGGFQQCWQSDIIGQPCDERDPETSWITEDRCDFVCRDGKYEFMPPPQG
jgi:hypothetical protein